MPIMSTITGSPKGGDIGYGLAAYATVPGNNGAPRLRGVSYTSRGTDTADYFSTYLLSRPCVGLDELTTVGRTRKRRTFAASNRTPRTCRDRRHCRVLVE